ncbi:MAG: alpha-L-fucosidase [Bacteroidetes bacterium GWF2_43_63]|nr:MAG: alpha-L-fucosidase [Bacteroidetes bacterium GWE2_42_42]OFY52962.1 MAG: alpha-L-fucosidase [Bacteroidetes bacterium GWF2_43_63]HBG70172.1 alpha-L-fucosidase [Bacteroidales bacterium]HCB62221.1 alpha-L-fucosidase [Bacteroidales bacterium]
MKYLLNISLLFLLATQAIAQTDTSHSARMQWFSDAKLGIFIHWGIYSTGRGSESWEFHNGHMSHKDYMAQISEFTAEKYDPAGWVSLIEKTGARYIVITSKHHDGVSLWDTKFNDLSTKKSSPAKRDVLTPFVNEVRKTDLKLGLYYSLIDWTHEDYPGFLRDSGRYEISADPKRWKKFIKFNNGQLSEILEQYNPDLVWFDGDWEHSAEEWDAAGIRERILKNNPNAIINGRLQGFGDYATPEQHFPVVRPQKENWELCMTMNDSWGYYITDSAYKTPYEIISIFADCISFGGNLLLDIGPKADGTIPEEQLFIMQELGQWNAKHSEAVFESVAGMPLGHFYGPTTISKDSTALYLFLQGNQSGNVILKGLNNDIKKIEVVGSNTPADFKVVGKISWSKVPGIVYIDVPEGVQDKYMTVLKVTLDGKLSLYRGEGGL